MLKYIKIFVSIIMIFMITACEDDYFPMPMEDGLVAVIPYIKKFDISIIHNGTTYGVVKSPYTGKYWLDKNLGARSVCESFADPYCRGDYYQWGRNADGHESNSVNPTDTLANNVNTVGHGNFILSNDTHPDNDWASVDHEGTQRQDNWSKSDGSTVCPNGFRVPTIEEFKAELLGPNSAQVNNRIDAFNSFLKLSASGYKSRITHGIFYGGEILYMWSSSVDGGVSKFVYFSDNAVAYHIAYRARGMSVRCISN